MYPVSRDIQQRRSPASQAAHPAPIRTASPGPTAILSTLVRPPTERNLQDAAAGVRNATFDRVISGTETAAWFGLSFFSGAIAGCTAFGTASVTRTWALRSGISTRVSNWSSSGIGIACGLLTTYVCTQVGNTLAMATGMITAAQAIPSIGMMCTGGGVALHIFANNTQPVQPDAGSRESLDGDIDDGDEEVAGQQSEALHTDANNLQHSGSGPHNDGSA